MNKKTLTIIILQLLIIVVLFWMLVFYGKDEYEAGKDDDEEVITSPSHITTENGAATITISPESQQQSGIATTTLESASHQAKISSFGMVVSLEPLLELRTRYLANSAEADVVRASLANSRADYERMEALNRDNRNVSDRAVANALATWKSDEARLASIETAKSSLRDAMRQQWGDTLADWATRHPAGDAMQRLLQHQEVLLQVTLPAEAQVHAKEKPLLISPAGSTGEPIKAAFVSASPQTDSILQGKTYYYRAPADSLRTGMRVNAALTDQVAPRAGVVIPASAVVWYANQPWVYQKSGDDKFVRIRINTDTETDRGWFNATGVKASDEIVTTGAQLLLSEEFKYQIKNENED
jgi:hypothetical protein